MRCHEKAAPASNQTAPEATEGDGLEAGVEAHQQGVVVQGHGGHQQIKAQHGGADLAAGLTQNDRPLPQIRRG
jgi:hypothetical protein